MNQRSDVRDDMYGWIPEKERVLVVGVGGQRGDERENQYGMEDSLAELAELAQSAGLEVVATLTQRMKHPHSGTYVGKGKMRELRRLCGLPDRTANDDDDDATCSLTHSPTHSPTPPAKTSSSTTNRSATRRTLMTWILPTSGGATSGRTRTNAR